MSRPGHLLGVLLAAVLFACGGSSHDELKLSPASETHVWRLAHSAAPLNSIALSRDGTKGWAVGHEGSVYRLSDGEWLLDDATSSLNIFGDLNTVWISSDAATGWAGGTSGMLRLANGRWERPPDPVSVREWINSIWVADDLSVGWAVGYGGVIRKLSGRSWQTLEHDAPLTDGMLWSVWATAEGDTGWAVGEKGIVLQLRSGQWSLDATASALTDTQLDSVWISADGSQGWIVGEGGLVLSLKDGSWEIDERASKLTSSWLSDVWVTPDLSIGWIVGEDGIVLSLTDGEWYIDASATGLTHLTLHTVRGSATGSTTLAAGYGGVLLQSRNGQWRKAKLSLPATDSHLNFLWVSPDQSCGWAGPHTVLTLESGAWTQDLVLESALGEESLQSISATPDCSRGWAVGTNGAFLELYQGAWTRTALPQELRDLRPSSLSTTHDLKSGWAVGSKGAILRLEEGRWKLHNSNLANDRWISDLSVDYEASRGWAVGQQGLVLQLEHDQWTIDQEASSLTDQDLFRVHITSGALTGMILGANDTVLHREGGRWTLRRSQEIFSGHRVRRLWLSEDGSRGWAITSTNSILHLVGTRWEEHTSVPTRFGRLVSVWATPSGEEGWAMGWPGLVYRLEPIRTPWPTLVTLDREKLFGLEGTHRLEFADSLATEPRVELLDNSNVSYISPTTPELRVSSVTQSNAYTLEFDRSSAAITEKLRGRWARLRVSATYDSFPDRVFVFETESFYVSGRPWWHSALAMGIGVLGLNVLLILLAVFWTPIRTLMLHPWGSNAIGLVLGKYLVTDLLLRYCAPLRKGLFHAYRVDLSNSPTVAGWSNRPYVSPTVSTDSFAASSAPRGSDVWQRLFDRILVQRRSGAFLLVGRSGLGKTALLEQWTRHALSLGQTPFFVALGSGASAEKEIAAQMAQYGDVYVQPSVARSLLIAGGFVVFFDGLNEDADSVGTRDLIRLLYKRNLVVVSSQSDPGWQMLLPTNQIRLEPFGEEQLAALMDKEWALKIQEQKLLFELCKLPATAHLVASFIKTNASLPDSHLEVYHDLTRVLERSFLLSLEEQAWQMFRLGAREFSSDSRLPRVQCDEAVVQRVLSRHRSEDEVRYRFSHDLVASFFVSRYLVRQGKRELQNWHEEVQGGLGHDHWIDVLEFWAEMILRRAEARDSAAEYRNFLMEVAAFSTRAFSERLYPQYDRLQSTGQIAYDRGFLEWAARALSKGAN